jgi:LacI family transcriptional regulator
MKRPTQVDVAKLAGVSRTTVSLVLNDQTDGKVAISEETRLRVRKAIDELGYEPDHHAQALRSGDTKTIGMIVVDMSNPHFWEKSDGIEQEARVQGYNVLLFTRSLDHDYIQRMFRDLAGRRIGGLILAGGLFRASPDARKALNIIHKFRLPVVEMCEYHPDYELDMMIADYSQATVEAMNYLLSLGHRRIGLVYGVAEMGQADDRLQPYCAALKNAGLPPDDLVMYCGPTVEDGYRSALKLLCMPNSPTAIIAINDLLAIGVLRAASDLGLQVPRDLSIIGYDDILLSRYLSPRLTTATQDIRDVGRDCVRLVLERIRNPDKPYQVIHSTSRLVIRESTGPAPDR